MRISSVFTSGVLCLAALCLGVSAVQAAGFLVGPRQNIVLFGDSITADGKYGQLMQDLIDQRYPERRICVLARGSHGDTVHGSFRRVDEDVVAWRSGWVLINFGINDVGRYTTEEFLRHYEALINRLYRDTDARVGIVSPIYQDRAEENPKLRAYVTGLQALAKQYDALYIPVYEETKRLRPTLPAGVKYATDGTHPNRLGCWIFAQTILRALQFPRSRTPIVDTLPARRTNSELADTLAGQTFTLALPTPVRITLTNPPLPEATIRPAAKPIVVDGKLDEWDLRAPILLDQLEQQVWGVCRRGDTRYSVKAYATYDAQAWYFAIAVPDSLVRNPAKTRNIVSRDSLEVCLDLRPAEERAAKPGFTFAPNKAHVYQYVLAPASAEMPALAAYGNGDRGMLDGVTVASTPTNAGYTLEFRVPAAHFPAPLAPGLRIGFDFAAIDVDRQDNYLSALEYRWSGSTLSSFNTREFGTLIFGQ